MPAALRDSIGRWVDSLPHEVRDRLRPAAAAPDGIVVVPCGPGHRARVAEGGLVLLDHDVAAELSLLAFGGDLPPCLLYKMAWDDALDGADGFLGEWAEDVDGDRFARARDDWHGNYWQSWPEEPAAGRVLFEPGLQAVLAAACARRWVQTRGPSGPGAAWLSVRRAVMLRARRAVVLSLAQVDAHRRPDALVPVFVKVVPEGRPSITGTLARSGSAIDLTLPVSWLWEVWQPGLALFEGRFTLAADGAELTVVEWRPTGGVRREHRPGVVKRLHLATG